jgi:hypothetical protein
MLLFGECYKNVHLKAYKLSIVQDVKLHNGISNYPSFNTLLETVASNG